MMKMSYREMIKLNIPPLYIRKTILNHKCQGLPFPGVYIFRNNKTNVYTGESGIMSTRLFQHGEFIDKNRYGTARNGNIYTHIDHYETQSKYIANALEMIIHHYFPPIIENQRHNIFHQIDLEKEYNDHGGKELELYELLGHSFIPILEDISKTVKRNDDN